MADLTISRVPKATAPTAVADSAIRDDGATVDVLGTDGTLITSTYGDATYAELDIKGPGGKGVFVYSDVYENSIGSIGDSPLMLMFVPAGLKIAGGDHVGVIPPSLPHGLAVTFSKAGFGEVNFHNLTNHATGTAGSYQGFSFHQKVTDTTELDVIYFGRYDVGANQFGELGVCGPDSTGSGVSIKALYSKDAEIASWSGGVTGADGVGVIPASQPNGLAVTFNYSGYGEVDLWNLTDSTANGEGFSFRQKLTSTTFHEVMWVGTWDTAAEFGLYAPGVGRGAGIYTASAPVKRTYIYGRAETPLTISIGPNPAGSGGGVQTLASVSTPAPTLGDMTVITDSTTNVWGATITGGGTNKVLAFYNGTNWTVAGATGSGTSLPSGTADDQLVYVSGAWTAQRPRYIISAFVPGVPTASQLLLLQRLSKAITIPANFGAYLGHTSMARGTVNATASTAIDVRKATSAVPGTFSSVGTITVAAGAMVGTFVSSGGTAITFAQGDSIQLLAPASPDATFANFACSLVGWET